MAKKKKNNDDNKKIEKKSLLTHNQLVVPNWPLHADTNIRMMDWKVQGMVVRVVCARSDAYIRMLD
jgi:hypothetical protein